MTQTNHLNLDRKANRLPRLELRLLANRITHFPPSRGVSIQRRRRAIFRFGFMVIFNRAYFALVSAREERASLAQRASPESRGTKCHLDRRERSCNSLQDKISHFVRNDM